VGAKVAEGRTRDESRDQAIMECALELLVEVGYDQMTMDALAARAHASKATIYRRWPGKQELIIDALRRRVPTEFEMPDTGNFRQDILEVLHRRAAQKTPADASLVAGVLRAMRATPEMAGLLRGYVMEDYGHAVGTLFARAHQRGELAPQADEELFKKVTWALVFFRLMIEGEAVDGPFLTRLVDEVLLPIFAPGERGTSGSRTRKRP
jgi:AcrR family transcriptional regulator